MRRDGLMTFGFAALGAIVSGLCALCYYTLLPIGRAMPGLFVDGRVQPSDVGLGDWLEQRRLSLLEREAYLVLPHDTTRVRFGDLGLELDVVASMETVLDDLERGSLRERLYRALSARRAERELPLQWSFDQNRARVLLQKLAPLVRREPVDARLDLEGHRRIEDQPGLDIDVDATLASIARGEREDATMFRVAMRETRAQVTAELLAEVDVSQVLGGFETYFGGTGAGRARNIATAARYLNGTVLGPGQTLSFNHAVGPRRTDRGFELAPVIIDDELEPGVGGGVCQVASTLHAAAVYGAMDVIERRSHSRPSGYAPIGLDATVVYGEVDLKIRNPYRSLLIVHAFLPTKTKLRVELLGRPSPGQVEHVYSVTRTHDFYRRVTTKSWFQRDESVRRQKGRKGFDLVSVVRISHSDGSQNERRYLSKYQPVPEVFWVGPGAALEELPELPEGAKHVEVDGVWDVGDLSGIDNPYLQGG